MMKTDGSKNLNHVLRDAAGGAGLFRKPSSVPPLIDIDLSGTSVLQRMVSRFQPMLESILCVDRINRLHQYHGSGAPTPQEYIRRIFDAVRVHWRLSAEELARIPRKGPLIVVANHPTGAIEGLALASILLSVRPDAKLMANLLLSRIPELRDVFLYVDPFGGSSSTASSTSGMRLALRHIRSGGALGVFPAGEVAHFDFKQRRVTDPQWSESITRLARISGAAVLPIFFEGRGSIAFNIAGMFRPMFRTAMLGREVFRHSGKRLGVRVGTAIPARRLAEFDSDAAATEFIRQRTFVLRHRPAQALALKPGRLKTSRLKTVPLAIRRKLSKQKVMEQIVAPVAPVLLTHEIAGLPEEQRLVTSDQFQVFWAAAHQIPAVLREIGRLREVTFRSTGEGSGKSIDLDAFDEYYLHLFMWDPVKQQIVGGYRMGRTDQILAERGVSGLYTSTLFLFDERLIHRVSPALEMGRSFVRAEYQRSYQPLLMLWKGISQYMVRHPRYRYLIGPVSISNTYQTISKVLMVEFLRAMHSHLDLAKLVTARKPFSGQLPRGMNAQHKSKLIDHDDLSDLVADIEPDQKGMPILLRHYLKLGAKLLAFNVDPDFGNCVDGLIVVDLANPNAPVDRYFGKEGRRSYLQYHAALGVEQGNGQGVGQGVGQ